MVMSCDVSHMTFATNDKYSGKEVTNHDEITFIYYLWHF